MVFVADDFWNLSNRCFNFTRGFTEGAHCEDDFDGDHSAVVANDVQIFSYDAEEVVDGDFNLLGISDNFGEGNPSSSHYDSDFDAG